MHPKLHDLPEECIREIILRINDYRDLESSSAAWTLMAALVSEQRVWRELTHFHFSVQQIESMRKKQLADKNRDRLVDGGTLNTHIDNTDNAIDWQSIYHTLRRYLIQLIH